jgi:hypothetical protein
MSSVEISWPGESENNERGSYIDTIEDR